MKHSRRGAPRPAALSLCAPLVVFAFLLLAPAARAQIFIEPQRAHRSLVRHFDFDWRHIDILGPEELPAHRRGANAPASGSVDAVAGRSRAASPQDEPASAADAEQGAEAAAETRGGVRLFFYERERHIAERAAGFLADEYRYLVEQFDFVPPERFPYILYNTYPEFLETNLFPLQEGILGVTSPQDLVLTLPYLGDHKLFQDVSTHELAHQFTIQKLRARAKATDTSYELMLQSLPLWFIEGLAEYYAQHSLDDEALMVANDIAINPNLDRAHGYLNFFDERPVSVLWIYKMGQVRVAFLEETYGKGTIQEVLDQANRLAGMGSLVPIVGTGMDFPRLLSEITGDEPHTIDRRFAAWLKRRAFGAYLRSQHDGPDVIPVAGWSAPVLAMTSSPSGNLLLFRTIVPHTGQTQLILTDYRAPHEATLVAEDNVPGIVSLHPIDGRNFDLRDDKLVFVAQADGTDVIYLQPLTHQTSHQQTRAPSPSPQGPSLSADISLGERRRVELEPYGIISATAPTFSPDGERVAFIGTSTDGVRDIYVLTPRAGGYRMQQLTSDPWAERDLAWGPSGIVFSSDATPHGYFNLFCSNPDEPLGRTQLTTEPRDHRDPVALPDGRIFYSAFEEGRANIYEVLEDKVVRRTDMATGLFDIGPGPEGGLWAAWYHAGERQPVRVPEKTLTRVAETLVGPHGEPWALPNRDLSSAQRYQPYSPANWNIGTLFGIIGAGGGSIFGRVLAIANDELRNHQLLLSLAIYGNFKFTDGVVLYLNQERRTIWGAGGFQTLQFRVDQSFPKGTVDTFISGERFFGALALARYPFNVFQYAEAEVAIGGVDYFLDTPERFFLREQGLLEAWRRANDGTRLQGEMTLRLGHDTIRYSPYTGPLEGSSLLLQGTGAVQPTERVTFGSVRLDAARYFALIGSANFFMRAGVGTTFGGRLARQFFLSSFETLRGVRFGDIDFLLGRRFYYATAELQVPLDRIVRVVFLPSVEGIVGVDFGAVGDGFDELWDKRVLDVALGTNFILGPLVFKLHFAHPINTGADPRRVGVPRSVPARSWVTNFSLNWLYF